MSLTSVLLFLECGWIGRMRDHIPVEDWHNEVMLGAPKKERATLRRQFMMMGSAP